MLLSIYFKDQIVDRERDNYKVKAMTNSKPPLI